MSILLESAAFTDGETIPKRFGYKHGNISPPLHISNIPQGTVSLALIVDDPDAMAAVGKVWVHWIVCNITPGLQFEEGKVPDGCIEGKTDFDEIGYGGPAPPDKEHTYIFKICALDQNLDTNRGITKSELESIMKDHIIDEATLTGRYAP